MRFDKRENYPLFDKADSSDTGLATNATADDSQATVKVGGVIRVRGNVPPNLTASRLTHPYLYKVVAGRYNPSGTSRFFGSRR